MNYTRLKSMTRANFELHVGFPKGSEKLADKLSKDWSRLTANKVLLAQGAEQRFREHNVPGSLGLLCTCHYTEIGDALEELEKLGVLFKTEKDVRFEIEEVLLSEYDKNLALRDPIPIEITPAELLSTKLIPDTPLFEMHFSIACKNGDAIKINENALIKIASSEEIKINEIVTFNDARKITTTTFFDNLDEMRDFSKVKSAKFISALNQADQNISIKQIAERIIFCSRPIGLD